MQKSVVFLYTEHEQFKDEVKRKINWQQYQKQYSGLNLTKVLYTENYKTFLKDPKKF